MMKSEFEKLAGRSVTDGQYRAPEILYMAGNFDYGDCVDETGGNR